MINEKQAKRYCGEDISLIENYSDAVNDKSQTWHCHHRKESDRTREELKAEGLYWGRPASELVFLTSAQHHDYSLHKGRGDAYQKRHKALMVNNPKTSRRVVQLSPDGAVIKVFPSMAQAFRETGIGKGNLWSACTGGRKFAGGYLWRYERELRT